MVNCKCDEQEPEFHGVLEEGLWTCSCNKIDYSKIPLDRVLREMDENNSIRDIER